MSEPDFWVSDPSHSVLGMDTKPLDPPLWFTPAFNFNATHLHQMTLVAGPTAKIRIETRRHKFDAIAELLEVQHATTSLLSLKIDLGERDELEVVPHLHATGDKARQLLPKIEPIRDSARRRFSARAFVAILVTAYLPSLVLDVVWHARLGDLEWRTLVPHAKIGTIVGCLVAGVVAAVAAASLVGSRITPHKPFFHVNANALKLCGATAVIGGVIGALLKSVF